MLVLVLALVLALVVVLSDWLIRSTMAAAAVYLDSFFA